MKQSQIKRMAIQLIAGKLHADIYSLSPKGQADLLAAMIEHLQGQGMELKITPEGYETTEPVAAILQRAIDLVASGGVRQ